MNDKCDYCVAKATWWTLIGTWIVWACDKHKSCVELDRVDIFPVIDRIKRIIP